MDGVSEIPLFEDIATDNNSDDDLDITLFDDVEKDNELFKPDEDNDISKTEDIDIIKNDDIDIIKNEDIDISKIEDIDISKTEDKDMTKTKTKTEDKDKTKTKTDGKDKPTTKTKTEDKDENIDRSRNEFIQMFHGAMKSRDKTGTWKRGRMVWVIWNDGHVSELCEKWTNPNGIYAYTRSEELRTYSGEVLFTREQKATVSKDKSDPYTDINELKIFKVFTVNDMTKPKTKTKTKNKTIIKIRPRLKIKIRLRMKIKIKQQLRQRLKIKIY